MPFNRHLDPRRSLRSRMAVSFGGAALVLAVGAGLYIGQRQEAELGEEIGTSYRQLAFLLGSDLGRWIDERHDDLVFASSLRSFRAAGEGELGRQREHLEDLQRWHPEYAWLGFADASGRVLSATGRVLEGADVAARPWFSAGLVRTYFGDMHESVLLRPLVAQARGEGTRLIDVAVPVAGIDGELRGVLAAHIGEAWVRGRLASLKQGAADLQAVEVLLVGRDGRALVSTRAAGAPAARFSGDWRPRGAGGHAVVEMEDARRYLVGFHDVGVHGEFGGFGWTVVARRDAASALLPAARARDAAFAAGLGGWLVFMTLGWIIAARVARPLEKITDAAARIRREEAAEIPQPGGEDEIGALATTLRSLVADLKRDESTMREREAELARILETMAEGVAIYDADGRIVMLNAASERILGVGRAAIVGRHYSNVPWRRLGADGRDLPLGQHPFALLEAGAERVEDAVFDIVTADGRPVTIQLGAAAIRDPDGTLAGMVATYADISERRRGEAALRRSEQLKSAIIGNALDAVVTIDHRGRIVEFNPAAEVCFGHERQRVIGGSMAELLVPPELRERHREGFQRCVETGEMRMAGRRVELPALKADGSRILVELAIVRIPGEDPPIFTAFVRDITERKRAEAATRLAQERLDRALEASKVALFEVEVPSGRVFLGESWSSMRGGAAVPTQTTVRELLQAIHPEDREALLAIGMAAIRGEREVYEAENRVQTIDGGWIWIISRARVVERDAEGHAVRLSGTAVDITERKHAEQRIHYLNTRDGLTDLSNRALFADSLEAAIGKASRQGARLALLAVGLDRFTAINDSLGHDIGDEVLKSVANRIIAAVGTEDVVARPGGDEFLVLLTQVDDPSAATRAAETIRSAVFSPILVAGHRPVLTASVGVALYPEDGDTAGVLLRNANTALNVAKTEGGNGTHFFAARMNAAARARFDTEAELRRALERDEFLLHFQPQVDLVTEAVVGWEALVRWNHPERGLLPPGRFLAIAEESGLIVPLGEQVLFKACRQAAGWRASGFKAARVSINVSAQQFRHPSFLKSVRSALASSGMEPQLLELEIVENALLGHDPVVQSVFDALGTAGVEISIDDFGTGYSSLGYLKRLPIDTVKIDQSFVRDIPASPEACAIVQAVVAMARGLGLRVVAEGIEQPGQVEFLRRSGCDRGQGYLYGRPEPAEHWSREQGGNVFPLRRPDAGGPR